MRLKHFSQSMLFEDNKVNERNNMHRGNPYNSGY